MVFASRTALAVLAVAAAAALSGCTAITTKVVVSNQSSKIDSALAQGKAIVIAKKTIFEPSVASHESIRLAGSLRPPLTYWQNRTTKEQLVLGGYETTEGRGSLLTNEYWFYIVDPGVYDLMGFVKKTRNMGNLYELPRADRPIESSIGFVKFSGTTLPQLYNYTAWVPPRPAGTTVYGNTITHWYEPGRHETRVGTKRIDAAFVDMRGMIPYNSKGAPNIATFGVEPGKIVLVGDFDLEYRHGRCDLPQQNLWICPLDEVMLRFSLAPLQAEVQQQLERLGYDFKIIRDISTAPVIPGAFFKDNQPERDSMGGYLRARALSVNAPRR